MPFKYKLLTSNKPATATKILRALGYNNKESQKIIDKGRMRTLDNQIIQKSQIITGDFWLCAFEPDGEIAPFFIHQDFALFNKPHNLLTHPKGQFQHQSLCDSIKTFLGKQAQPLHRLDYETSGILLASRDKKAEIALKKAFEEKRITKTYLALVHGIVSQDYIIDAPILTPRKDRQGDLSIRCSIHQDGKASQTHIQPIAYINQMQEIQLHKNCPPEDMHLLKSLGTITDKKIAAIYTLLKVYPLTGRTHQIRLHLAHIHHPIINEPLYCDDAKAREYLDNKLKITDDKRFLRLHALSLNFSYKNIQYIFKIPCHKDFLKLEDF